MRNYFRIDEDAHAIYQLFLGDIDASFATASLAEVRTHPNYNRSMAWLIDLSEYQSKGRLGIDARLDKIVRHGIGFHLGKSAIILDRPYQAAIRHREGNRDSESGVRFFVNKLDALGFLESEAVDLA